VMGTVAVPLLAVQAATVSFAVAGRLGIAAVQELPLYVGVTLTAPPVLVLIATAVSLSVPQALMVKVFSVQVDGSVRVMVPNLKTPVASTALSKLVEGVRVTFPQAAAVAIPCPNSMESLLTVIEPASVEPIVGTKITAARPSAILRLRVLLFFFVAGISSEPKFKVFIFFLLLSRFLVFFWFFYYLKMQLLLRKLRLRIS